MYVCMYVCADVCVCVCVQMCVCVSVKESHTEYTGVQQWCMKQRMLGVVVAAGWSSRAESRAERDHTRPNEWGQDTPATHTEWTNTGLNRMVQSSLYHLH